MVFNIRKMRKQEKARLKRLRLEEEARRAEEEERIARDKLQAQAMREAEIKAREVISEKNERRLMAGEEMWGRFIEEQEFAQVGRARRKVAGDSRGSATKYRRKVRVTSQVAESINSHVAVKVWFITGGESVNQPHQEH